MAAVQSASFEGLRQRIQRLDPLSRLRPIRRQKGAAEQVYKRRGQRFERQRAGRLAHLTNFGVGAVCEAGFSDRPLQRHLSRAEKRARKRMPAHKEKLKDDDRQSEAVMRLRAIDIAEGDALQFRRGVSRKAAIAAIDLPSTET
jgi:hypothetical protein